MRGYFKGCSRIQYLLQDVFNLIHNIIIPLPMLALLHVSVGRRY